MKFDVKTVLNEDALRFGGIRAFFKNQLLRVRSTRPMCMCAHHAAPSMQGRACSCTYIGSRKCYLLLLSSSFNAMGRECAAHKLACFVKGLSRRDTAGHVSGVGRSRSGDAVYHLFCLLKH